MSYPRNHLGLIWYHSEPSDVPYSLNQFLGWDFFCRFLQQAGSSQFSKPLYSPEQLGVTKAQKNPTFSTATDTPTAGTVGLAAQRQNQKNQETQGEECHPAYGHYWYVLIHQKHYEGDGMEKEQDVAKRQTDSQTSKNQLTTRCGRFTRHLGQTTVCLVKQT